jgi:uncharacterized protein (TIGR03435 family)
MRRQELLALGIFSSRSRLRDRIELLLRRGRTFSPRVSAARLTVGVFALLGSVIVTSFAPRLLAFAPQPAFDAASIKPNNAVSGGGGRGGPGSGYLKYPPGRVIGTATARTIILEAYHLTAHQLSGGPGWLDNDKFDIEGKAATSADKDQLRLMLQTMLAERFKLAVRHETREMPVYALIVGKNGPKLPDLKPDDAGFVKVPAPAGEGNAGGNGLITRGSMQDFAFLLSGNPSIDRPVLDKTGIQGNYGLLVHWNADEDFMTAMQDQLGLKFESQKAQVETIVIDHIEKPDAN